MDPCHGARENVSVWESMEMEWVGGGGCDQPCRKVQGATHLLLAQGQLAAGQCSVILTAAPAGPSNWQYSLSESCLLSISNCVTCECQSEMSTSNQTHWINLMVDPSSWFSVFTPCFVSFFCDIRMCVIILFLHGSPFNNFNSVAWKVGELNSHVQFPHSSNRRLIQWGCLLVSWKNRITQSVAHHLLYPISL